MIIVKAKEKDLPQIMDIVNEAKAYLKSKGINQWQNGYPNEETFLNDISLGRLYVLKDEEVLGVYALVDYEDTYDVIDGKWLTDGDYVAVHRIAVKEKYKGQGLAKVMFDDLKKKYPVIRIDTHDLNESMKKCLKNNDFTYCGIITLHDGFLRNAYEWRKE